MKILLVEDNTNLAKSIIRVLKQECFSVAHFSNGEEAYNYWLTAHDEIDAVILDIQLPGKNGFDICESVRKEGIATPVVMLTAKQELDDKVQGLTLGADDYLAKPFQFEELLARISAILRRPQQINTQTVIITEGICFDAQARKVTKNEEEISLTPKEFEILEFLVRNKNKALSQQNIFDHCFDFAKDNWSNTVEVHIKNLRKKLFSHTDAQPLKTVRGFGYRLEIE